MTPSPANIQEFIRIVEVLTRRGAQDKARDSPQGINCIFLQKTANICTSLQICALNCKSVPLTANICKEPQRLRI